MICDKWDKLSYPEKIIATGEIMHVFQSSDKYFDILCDVINQAHREGLLSNIKILPETKEPEY